MRGLLPGSREKSEGYGRHCMVVVLAVWAVLAQAFIPAFHRHDGPVTGWHQQSGSDQPDQDGGDDCPICQAAQAIGATILSAPPSPPILVPVVLRAGIPEPPGYMDRRETFRPRQRAPPSLI